MSDTEGPQSEINESLHALITGHAVATGDLFMALIRALEEIDGAANVKIWEQLRSLRSLYEHALQPERFAEHDRVNLYRYHLGSATIDYLRDGDDFRFQAAGL